MGLAWRVLNDGKIAQMWFVSDRDDASRIQTAESIANALVSPQ